MKVAQADQLHKPVAEIKDIPQGILGLIACVCAQLWGRKASSLAVDQAVASARRGHMKIRSRIIPSVDFKFTSCCQRAPKQRIFILKLGLIVDLLHS